MARSRLGLACLLALALSTSLPAAAQAGGAEPSGSDLAAEPSTEDQLHDELRAVRAAMEGALNTRDLDGLLAHVAPEVVFTTMNGDVVRGPEGIRGYFAEMLEGPDRVVESVTSSFEPEALSILYGGDTAVSYGRADDRYQLADGRTFEVAARWTATLVRRDGGWKIAAFHYSTNMFDNPVLAAQRRVLMWVAIGAAAVAFIVALLIGRALGRRAAA